MDRTQQIRASAILFVLCTAAAAAQRPRPSPPPDLDTYVTQVLQAFEVPGAALAVVKDGATVLAKGYGVRKLGDTAAVDARTLFGIASNTKVFTATALGLLVEAGKIEWDAPVIRYLPPFAMFDPYVTRELTVRDLLVHRSGLGLGAGDLLQWPPTTYTRKEIVHRLRYLKPATSFRSTYAYDNVLYLVAGELVEAVSGQTWEDFVADRILAKVGMTQSSTRISALASAGNAAAAHARIGAEVRPIARFIEDSIDPAGGINSCADDMAKWLRVRLADGMLTTGSRLFTVETARQLTTLVTPVPAGDPPREMPVLRTEFNGYALGLGVRDYRGHKLVTHDGGLPGYVSRVSIIPDAGVGVALLTNQESTPALGAIVYHILDSVLGAPPFDWLAAYKSANARDEAQVAEMERKSAATRDAQSRPSLLPERYAGLYWDAWYGDITIAAESGKLVMRFSHTPSLVGDLEHWQYDTFIVRWRDRELRADAYVTFTLNPDGSIDHARMRAVSPATDFSFDFHDLLLKRSKDRL